MEDVLQFLRESEGIWPLIVLFAAAALEYMVPFLPGDTVVLAGSLLVVAGRWPLWVVATWAIAGGLFGSAVHYFIGRSLVRPDGTLRGGKFIDHLGGQAAFDRFFAAFRRYGMWVMALNRAVPGVRAVAFIAAGAAKLPPVKTLFFGLISNIAWSLMMIGAGVAVGGNWEKIKAALGVYQWIVFGLLVAIVVFTLAIRKRRARRV